MVFQASNFADVAENWGISFTVWKQGQESANEFLMNTKELNTDTFQIIKNGTKVIYPAINPASFWVREIIKGLPMIEAPNLTSAIGVTQKDKKMVDGALGCMNSNSNNVYKNGTDVFIVSSCSSLNANVSVLPSNFRRCIALFAARKTIKPDWINCKDEYLVPNEKHPDYNQWVNDALVYALFNTSSQQSSLRDVQYKGKTWNIENHWFFMSQKEMLQLADKANFDELYQDAKNGEDSFVYKQLESLTLSDDAKAVLEAAKSLVRASIGLRKQYHQDHPELNLQAWSAGWAQLKPLLKDQFKGAYKQFTETYKVFERRMTKGVYEFGFLKV